MSSARFLHSLAGALVVWTAGGCQSPALQSGNPCVELNGGCDPNATCTDNHGSASCACNAGYSGDGTTCAAIDLCSTGNGGCDPNATCQSTGAGTRTCLCNSGYAGDGTTCTAVDDCTTGNGGCDPNATCTSTGPGTNNCTCNAGYAGDGTTCHLSSLQVTVSGADLTVTPTSPVTVAYGMTQALTVTGNAGYVVSSTVGGTCPSGSWSTGVYTTGPITADCSVSFSAALTTVEATPSGDGNETFAPAIPQAVTYGDAASFTVTANAGYVVSNMVGGTCPAGSWSTGVYTTGPITADCSVSFSAALTTVEATPSGDGNETFTPAIPQAVTYGDAASFTVTANAGYVLAEAVGGTCAAGTWSSGVYSTGPVTADCTVTFSAVLITLQVMTGGDGNETITPSGPATVTYGSTQSLTVTASAGYTVSTSVGGSCPPGSWSGDVYTTAPITGSCAVSFTSSVITFQVTASGDSGDLIMPSSVQTVTYDGMQTYTVTATAGSTVTTQVGGTCSIGAWSGNQYMTGAITADCSVVFASSLQSYQVTGSGDACETITPGSPQTVSYQAAQTYQVTANAGCSLSTSVGGTCPVGAWSGGAYTTGPIIGACTVVFSGTRLTSQVTSGGDGNETITPDGPQTVVNGATQAFTVTANAGYTVSTMVGGTCPSGSWSGSVYTTDAITSDCTVLFAAMSTCDASSSGLTPSTAAASCDAIHLACPTVGDGAYWIEPGATPVQVWCDMTTDAGGWTVLLSATHPLLWGTLSGTPGTGEWSQSAAQVPVGITELNLLYVAMGESITMPIAASELFGPSACTMSSGMYSWNGTLTNDFNAIHLGIFMDGVWFGGATNYVISSHGCVTDQQSWGFGHRAYSNDMQGYGWNSLDLGVTTFQISVR